jgi:hypothetical protein
MPIPYVEFWTDLAGLLSPPRRLQGADLYSLVYALRAERPKHESGISVSAVFSTLEEVTPPPSFPFSVEVLIHSEWIEVGFTRK